MKTAEQKAKAAAYMRTWYARNKARLQADPDWIAKKRARDSAWARANKQRVAVTRKKSNAKNKEARRIRRKRWYDENREYALQYAKAWADKNRDAIRARLRLPENASKLAEKSRNRRKANPEKAKEIWAKSDRKRQATIHGRLRLRIQSMIRYSLRNCDGKRRRKSEELVGWKVDELRRHIERQFTPGMSWERLAAGEIHIDHILPLKSFNITGPDCPELKRAWALTNLRPLWADENMQKSAKVLYLI